MAAATFTKQMTLGESGTAGAFAGLALLSTRLYCPKSTYRPNPVASAISSNPLRHAPWTQSQVFRTFVWRGLAISVRLEAKPPPEQLGLPHQPESQVARRKPAAQPPARASRMKSVT